MSRLSQQQLDQLRSELATRGKIAAVKLYKDWTKCSLLDAKNAVEAIERAEPIPEPPQATGGSVTEDQMRQIDDAIARGKKLNAVKLYREYTGHSLMDSKRFVEARMDGADDAADTRRTPSTSAVESKRSGCFSVILLMVTLAVAIVGAST